MRIELNAEEETLRKEMLGWLDKAKTALAASRMNEDVRIGIEEAGKRAHELHLLLKARDSEPKHHAYMINNRGLQPDDPQFYVHIHPIEDLLKYLDDSHANDDPVDQTISAEFTFNVFSRRQGHEDTYKLKRTADGWYVANIGINGPCDKAGRPFLYKNFRQDSIQYPCGVEGRMEWLWEQAASQGLTATRVQDALSEIASWVSLTERSAPSGGIWAGY